MAERLWEAHDLIVKAWTTHDGPFNWEGRFFHQRHVNIWPRPYQQPHPPVWVTALTPGSVGAIADHGHVVACFLTGFEGARQVFDAYRQRDEERGRPPTAHDRLGYAALVYTGRTDAEGIEGAKKLLWYVTANKVPPHFAYPPGYVPFGVRASNLAGAMPDLSQMRFEESVDNGILFAGSPVTVGQQIEDFYDRVGGFGHLLVMGQAGFLEHDETVVGIELFASEVAPRLRAGVGTLRSS